MEPRFRRNLMWVAAVHLAVILVLLCSGLLQKLFRDRTPKEVVTYVNLQTTMPEPAPPVAEAAPPAPAPEPPPPEPVAPPPEPKPIPKPKKKQIEMSKKRVKRQEMAPKPAPRKAPSQADIRKMLAPSQASPSNAAVDDFPFDWYYSLVRSACYEAWKRPSTSSVQPGTMAVALIRVFRDGSVRDQRLLRASGNPAMDASVLKAALKVQQLKPLPAKYKGEYKDITIEFVLDGNV